MRLALRAVLVPLIAGVAWLALLVSVGAALPGPPAEPPASMLGDWWVFQVGAGAFVTVFLGTVLPMAWIAAQRGGRRGARWIPYVPAIAATAVLAVALRGPDVGGRAVAVQLAVASLLAGAPLAIAAALCARALRGTRASPERAA